MSGWTGDEDSRMAQVISTQYWFRGNSEAWPSRVYDAPPSPHEMSLALAQVHRRRLPYWGWLNYTNRANKAVIVPSSQHARVNWEKVTPVQKRLLPGHVVQRRKGEMVGFVPS